MVDKDIKIDGLLETFPGKSITVNATLQEFGKKELNQLQIVFRAWTEMNKEIAKLDSRKANFHEVISEGALAYFMHCPRIIKFNKKEFGKTEKELKKKLAKEMYGANMIKELKEKIGTRKEDEASKKIKELEVFVGQKAPSVSFDNYDEISCKTIQVKASIGVTEDGKHIHKDLTSFGPNSKFQRLLFLDFYDDGKISGKFDVWDISLDKLDKVKVNKNTTFAQSQKSGKRPHLSIIEELIDKGYADKIDSFDLEP